VLGRACPGKASGGDGDATGLSRARGLGAPFRTPRRAAAVFLSGEPVFFGTVVLQPQDFAIVGICTFLMLVLWAFFSLSMTGKALRATSQNPAAALVSVPVRTMHDGGASPRACRRWPASCCRPSSPGRPTWA
jgi:hypothetical protein